MQKANTTTPITPQPSCLSNRKAPVPLRTDTSNKRRTRQTGNLERPLGRLIPPVIRLATRLLRVATSCDPREAGQHDCDRHCCRAEHQHILIVAATGSEPETPVEPRSKNHERCGGKHVSACFGPQRGKAVIRLRHVPNHAADKYRQVRSRGDQEGTYKRRRWKWAKKTKSQKP